MIKLFFQTGMWVALSKLGNLVHEED